MTNNRLTNDELRIILGLSSLLTSDVLLFYCSIVQKEFSYKTIT